METKFVASNSSHQKSIPEFAAYFEINNNTNEFKITPRNSLLDIFRNDFRIIIGQKTYLVNKFLAASVIPAIHQVVYEEGNDFSYQVDLSQFEDDNTKESVQKQYSILCYLLSSNSITLTIDIASELLTLSKIIQNAKFTLFLQKFWEKKSKTIEFINSFSQSINLYTTILSLLTNLNENNLDVSIGQIFSIFNKHDDIRKSLCCLILFASTIRPYQNEILAQFCKNILSELNSLNFFEQLSYHNPFFLRCLHKYGLINIKKLLESISIKSPLLFIWFSPELEKNDRKRFYNLLEQFRGLYPQPKRNKAKSVEEDWFTDQRSYFLNIKSIYQNDWNLFYKYVEIGSNPSDLATAIRKDDFEAFQNITNSQNLDTTIQITLFERSEFLHFKQPFLIEYAAYFGSIRIFKFILSHTNDALHNSLEYAVAGGSVEIITLCEMKNSDIFQGFRAAIDYSQNEIFEWMFDKLMNDDWSNTSDEVHSDIENFTFDSYKKHYFFDFREIFNLSDHSMSLTEYCCKKNNLLAMQLFLEKGFELTSNCMDLAVQNDNLLLAKIIFESGKYKPNIQIIHTAIISNSPFVLAFLLSQVFSSELQQNNESNFLFDAIESGYPTILNILLESNLFDLNGIKDIELNSPVNSSSASSSQNSEPNLDTPLIAACKKGDLSVLRVLLKYKDNLNFNHINHDGMTALMVAAERGFADIVTELCAIKEVDLTVKKNNLTADKIANANNYWNICSIIVKEQRRRSKS